MATEALDIVVKESGSREVNRNIDDVGKTAEGAEKKVDSLGNALSKLKTLLAAVGIGFGIKQLVEYSDTYTDIINKLKLVSSSTAELAASEQALFDVSQRTTTGFKDNVETFAALSKATKQYGISSKEVLGVTEIIANALDASGKSAKQASGSIGQLVKGLSSGEVGGRAFVSMFKQVPILAEAVAKGLGVPISSLNELTAKGGLTAKAMFEALQKSKDFVAQMQALKTDTISDALGNLSNAAMRFVGQMNNANGVSSLLVSTIMFLAENFNTLAKVLGIVLVTFGAYRAALLVTAAATFLLASAETGVLAAVLAHAAANGILSASLAVLRGLLASVWAIFLANPFVFIVVTLTALVGLVYAFGNSIKLTADGSITALGALTGVWNTLKWAIGQVADFLQACIIWVYNNDTAMNVLKATVVVLAAAFLYMAATQIVNFFTTLATVVARVGAAMLTLLLNPITLTTAAFLAGAIAIAYYTGSLDTIVAKAEKVGASLTKSMVDATKEITAASNTTDKLGKDLKVAGDTGGEAFDNIKKKAAGATKSVKELTQATDYMVKTTMDANGKMKFSVEEVSNAVQDPIKAMNELRKSAAQASADIQNGMADAADSTETLALACRRGTQAYYDLQNAANGAATAISSASAASASTGSSGSGSGGSRTPGGTNPAPQAYTTDYSPKWWGGPRNDVASIGGAGLAQAIDGWLGKWGGRAVSQGDDFANVSAMARQLPQEVRDRLKDTGYSWIPGLRYGGQMMVPGSGGPDSQLAQLRVTPGERITVETPEQQRRRRTDGGATTNQITVQMTVVTPDAESFSRSKEQINMELLSQLQQVAGRF